MLTVVQRRVPVVVEATHLQLQAPVVTVELRVPAATAVLEALVPVAIRDMLLLEEAEAAVEGSAPSTLTIQGIKAAVVAECCWWLWLRWA